MKKDVKILSTCCFAFLNAIWSDKIEKEGGKVDEHLTERLKRNLIKYVDEFPLHEVRNYATKRQKLVKLLKEVPVPSMINMFECIADEYDLVEVDSVISDLKVISPCQVMMPPDQKIMDEFKRITIGKV